jgi:hypothetical protein
MRPAGARESSLPAARGADRAQSSADFGARELVLDRADRMVAVVTRLGA